MSDLWSTLGVAARALEAQRFGLDVTGQNIANAGTPGYARRQADLVEVPGRGVEARGVIALRDLMIERRLRDERPVAGREDAVAASLALVETTIGAPGESLDASLTSFFDAFADLSVDPASGTARQAVVLAGRGLSETFSAIDRGLRDAQRQADGQVRAAVEEINGLVDRIATLNQSIRRAPAGTTLAAGLQDELQQTLQQVSGFIGVDVVPHDDGSVDVTFGGGRALVVGQQVQPLTVTSGPPYGYAVLTSGSATVTAEITSGRLGGFLAARDSLIPQYQADLDTLAFAVADKVNTLHATGFDGSGNPGGAFFTPIGVVAGAAGALQVAPAVVADPGLIAAAGAALAGDNQIATAIAALRDAPAVVGSFTFAEAWGHLAFQVGHDVRTATEERDRGAEVVRQMQALRDQVSGVSLDEEALKLMQFQRAYEANARVFRAADEALQTLLGIVRG